MITYVSAVALIVIGTYAIVVKDNLIKKVIGLGLFTNGIHLLLISIGYRAGGIAPIFLEGMDLSHFSLTAVDPLPQALVLTSIVIELSVVALALTLIIKYHRVAGTLNSSKNV